MITEVNVNELYPRWLVVHEGDDGRDFHLIDVRAADEYARMHVPGARLIPLSALMARAGEIPKTGTVYMICHAGGRSAQACQFLQHQFGYDNLVNIKGGTMAWEQAGYPLEQGV